MSKAAWAAGAVLGLAAFAAHAGVAREEILILDPDARGYTVYKTLRSDLGKRALYLPPGETPEDYLYIHPSDYRSEPSDAGSRLVFDQGSYALMRTARFADWQLTPNADGSVTFHSWDGRELANGHYGKWNAPEPFGHFSYVWVLPAGLQILDYHCNREGQWQRRGRSLSWSGQEVNDLTFRITFRRRPPPTLRTSPAPAAPAPLVDAERITLDSAVLFPSGSAHLTPAGERLLTELARRLAASKPVHVVVEGHTDNQPLKPYLRRRYPSNWELSAARATGVVRFLADHGVDGSVLEARAFGAQRPVADNATALGRARNRRIEIIISKGAGAAQASAGSG